MKHIAIFASGSGTNAEAIMSHFKGIDNVCIKLLLSNKAEAYALKRAENFGVPTVVFSREDFYTSDRVIERLKQENIDFIVLAGFLWLVPDNILDVYAGRIINIHPALLPKYGGKGMYGDNVHKAVIDAAEKESGITIHYVSGPYDSGDVIFQATTDVSPEDTPQSLAEKIHRLEYQYFPVVVEKVINAL